MRTLPDFLPPILLGLFVLGLGCDGTVYTGTAPKPVNNKPAADGTCPTGRTRCGTGIFAICVDLPNDPNHCGACDRACTPGIACQTGVCQQTKCTRTAIPFAGQPTTSPAAADVPPAGAYLMSPNLILADVNGDGRLDRIEWLSVGGICDPCPMDLSEFRVSLRQPDGSFAPPTPYHARDVILRVLVTEVNSDGLADLYIVSWTYSHATKNPQHMEVWLGQHDGNLRRYDAANLTIDSPGSFGNEVAIGDLSGDGWPDLVIAAPTPSPEDPPKLSVLLSDSTGALHVSQTFQALTLHTFIRDWNGDGSPDLAVLDGHMAILFNRGDGTFAPMVDCALFVGGGSVNSEDLVVEDFNHDGWMDLAVGSLVSQRVGVMFGLGGCGFSPIRYYDIPGSYTGFLRAADMNGDGILDLVSVNMATNRDPTDPTANSTMFIKDYLLSMLIGHADGTFQLSDQVISLGPNMVTNVTIGEVSGGDQRPDIVVSSLSGLTGQTSVWENTCQ